MLTGTGIVIVVLKSKDEDLYGLNHLSLVKNRVAAPQEMMGADHCEQNVLEYDNYLLRRSETVGAKLPK